MDEHQIRTAQQSLAAAYEGTMDFPTIVRSLIDAGFEGYTIDFRTAKASYFLPNGQSHGLVLPKSTDAIAARFDPSAVERAVREAQAKSPGYTYAGFCTKVKAGGCAGYMVSFLGKRVVYYGRTGETHVEHFPR